MKTGKNARQELILKLIRERDISTQDDLTKLVREAGFEATHATCSRDIKELGIIKITLHNKSTKYAVLDRTGDVAPGRLLAVFIILTSATAKFAMQSANANARQIFRAAGILTIYFQRKPSARKAAPSIQNIQLNQDLLVTRALTPSP